MNGLSHFTLLFPAVGLLLALLGWPLATRRVGPNRWYGLRVPATFADRQVWYDANEIAGRDLMTLGIALILASLLLPRLVSLTQATYGAVCAALLGVGALVMTVRGWRAANRLLRERRDSDRTSGRH
jgi:uncharacterized membrane protein